MNTDFSLVCYCQTCWNKTSCKKEYDYIQNNEYFCKQCFDNLEQYYKQNYNDYLLEKATEFWNRQYEDAEVFVYEDKPYSVAL